jgi:hypothetical protein
VERGLAVPAAGRPGRRRRAIAVAAVLGAAAAAVLLALALRNLPRPAPPVDGPPAAEEPWPVASADDVQIISMDDRDRGALVVGQPPVNELVQLLAVNEVQVNKLEPDEQGRVGRLYGMDGSGSPMVIMPLDSDPDEDP